MSISKDAERQRAGACLADLSEGLLFDAKELGVGLADLRVAADLTQTQLVRLGERVRSVQHLGQHTNFRMGLKVIEWFKPAQPTALYIPRSTSLRSISITSSTTSGT